MLGGKKRTYLDYASATPLGDAALRAMRHVESIYANPGSLHEDGVAAKKSLEASREAIAHELACKARQVIFTSGLTEGNNLAILGFARALHIKGVDLRETHWITASIEHSSVLECFAEIERLGGTVTFLDPDPSGLIAVEALERALRPNTVFVSVGWANNEIGVVQRLAKLSRAIRAHEKAHKSDVIFHSDAGQGPLYLSPQVHTLGVDALSLGSGKLYGPRGIGALYTREPEKFAAVTIGGGQERGLRAGTEEVALAAGFAAALRVLPAERAKEGKRLGLLRDALAQKLERDMPGLLFNGVPKHVLPHMLNISVPGEKDGEYLSLQLDRAGFALSTKSACDEGNRNSHVVAALGGPSWRAAHTLRISLGKGTTLVELKRFADALLRIAAPK